MFSITFEMDVYFNRGGNVGEEFIGNLKNGIEIQCHEKNHMKYYRMEYENGILRRQWGRIGNAPQVLEEELDNFSACIEVERILKDKYNKGYRLEKDKILHELGIL